MKPIDESLLVLANNSTTASRTKPDGVLPPYVCGEGRFRRGYGWNIYLSPRGVAVICLVTCIQRKGKWNVIKDKHSGMLDRNKQMVGLDGHTADEVEDVKQQNVKV